MVRRIAIGCLAMLLAGWAAPAQADLVVYVQDTTVTAGSTTELSVYIGSTSVPTSNDAFDSFQIQLDSNASSPNQLGFTTNGSAAYLNDSSYIYGSGNSGDAANGFNPATYPPPYNSPSTIVAPTILIGDFANSGLPAPLDNVPGDTLLGQVQIYALNTVPGTYTVTLDLTSGNTVFNNSSTGDNLPYTQGIANGFTGTITVIAPAAIPEPASVVSGMTALVLIAGWHGVRRLRRSKGQSV
jgi:hypothetical protein